jgi:hypothetical protein
MKLSSSENVAISIKAAAVETVDVPPQDILISDY